MHGDEHFRGIGHLPEAGAGHLEDGQLAGGTKAVFDAPEHPVGATVLAFELQDHIDNMLQNLGPGDGAFLGNMADQDDGDTCRFGKAQQLGRHFLDLAHAAGGGVHVLAVHGLHGVHNHQVRGRFFCLLENLGHVGLAVDEDAGGVAAQTVGPHFHLLYAFFTGDVERFKGRGVQGQLQGKGTFADAGLAAHQYQRTLDDTAAQQAIDLCAAQGNAVLL